MAADLQLARQQLEERFGLAMPAVSEAELLAAVAAAGAFEGAGFLDRLVDALPIDESSLFRHPELWRWLEQNALVGLVERALGGGAPVRILSLGCACGQELFSALILAARLLRARGVPRGFEGPFVRGLGIDASAARVARARSGRLNAWSVQRAAADWVGDAAKPAGELGEYQLEAALLALADFECGNVLERVRPGAGVDGFDLVLCQNVFIYFRAELAGAVLAALVEGLSPRAVLALAPVEAHLLALPGVAERCESTAFVGVVRRRSPGATAAPVAPRLPRAPAVAVAPKVAAAAVQRLVEEALQAASGGRVSEGLACARAALTADPSCLVAQLVLGRILLSVDRRGGRRVLEALQRRAAALRPDAQVPLSDLSVEQLSRAASLLLGTSG
jgi:chemotaxis protein methyltransferase CheR